jgi:hypothetical protein
MGNYGGYLLGLNEVLFDILDVRLGQFSIIVSLRNKSDNFSWCFSAVYDPNLSNLK